MIKNRVVVQKRWCFDRLNVSASSTTADAWAEPKEQAQCFDKLNSRVSAGSTTADAWAEPKELRFWLLNLSKPESPAFARLPKIV